MARWDDERMWERYTAILHTLDGLKVTEALSCLMVALIHVAKATHTSLFMCVKALVDLWEDDTRDSLIVTEEEEGPPTERMPRTLN